MAKYSDNYPANHEYKRYLGENKGDLRHEGITSQNLGDCLEETRALSELPERILKSTR